jgi:hypothetical protein
MARRTKMPTIESSTTAMIGQIQICFFRKTPVREMLRPTLEVAQVMWGEWRCCPPAVLRNQESGFIDAML